MNAPSTPADRDALLRDQPWPTILAQMTAFAFKRTRRRSWELAQEIAQQAIAQAHERKKGWDPAKGSLLGFLAGQVVSLSLGEWRRKRNAYEVVLDDEEYEALADGGELADAALDRRRREVLFRERLLVRLAGDVVALEIVTLMMEDIDTPRDLAAATGRPIAEVREARRRVRYHAEQVTKALAIELDAEDAEVRS